MNLLGKRQTEIYGNKDNKFIKKKIIKKYGKLFNIKIFQSNSESKIIENIHKNSPDFYIINMAGLSYSSVSILDALIAKKAKFIEVHMSNIFKREKFRSKSIFSKYSSGVIVGFGHMVYILALEYIKNLYY